MEESNIQVDNALQNEGYNSSPQIPNINESLQNKNIPRERVLVNQDELYSPKLSQSKHDKKKQKGSSVVRLSNPLANFKNLGNRGINDNSPINLQRKNIIETHSNKPQRYSENNRRDKDKKKDKKKKKSNKKSSRNDENSSLEISKTPDLENAIQPKRDSDLIQPKRSSTLENNKNKLVFQSHKQINNPNKKGLLGSSNMNAVMPLSSIPSFNNDIPESLRRRSVKKPVTKNLEQIIAQNYREELWKIHEQVLNRKQLLTDEGDYSRQTNLKLGSTSDCCKRLAMKACFCFSKCLPVFDYVDRYQFNLKIETITCNKLSHCLFDFDCPDFAQYEHEQYDHQVFKFHSLFSNSNEPKMLSLLDLNFNRDQMIIKHEPNKVDKTQYLKSYSADSKVQLPFPTIDPAKKSRFLFRVVFKPESGQLWGFNDYNCDKDLVLESDLHQILQQQPKQEDANDTQQNDQSNANERDMSRMGMLVNQSNPGIHLNTSNILARSEGIHSRLNLLDDQITINYDLNPTTVPVEKEKVGENSKPKKTRKKLSKMEKLAKENNFHALPQEQLDKEIEFENDVDLGKTMWHVIRNKKSCNNYLKRFETTDQLHFLKVNDIVKFGRVNFKVSIIKSDKLSLDIQGGYHLLEKKNQEIQVQLEKIQNLQTQQGSYREVSKQRTHKTDLKHFDSTLGLGDLDQELRRGPAGREGPPSPPSAEADPYGLQTHLHRDATRQELNHRATQNAAQMTMGRSHNEADANDSEIMIHNQMQVSRNQIQVEKTTENQLQRGQSHTADVNFIDNRTELNKSGAFLKAGKDAKSDEDFNEGRSSMRSSPKSSVIAGSANQETAVCRICLGTEEEGTPAEDGLPDKLICPCKCAGSMGMIHISCLKEWVNSKRLVYKGKKVQSFFWKALECELCQEPFENRMRYRMFQIMKFGLPNNENEYMILESIKSAPAKVIHVFDLRLCNGSNGPTDEIYEAENEFRVGRSVDTDMKIADISVSRVHSFIRVSGNRLVVQDNGSKFGTLIKVNAPSALVNLGDIQNPKENTKAYSASIYQVGRTMFYFKFYNIQSQLAKKDNQISKISSKLVHDSNNIDLAFVPWKGTTFWRKTMLQHSLSYIPREFVPNEFKIDKEYADQQNIQKMYQHELSHLQLKTDSQESLQDNESVESSLSIGQRNMRLQNRKNKETFRQSQQAMMNQRVSYNNMSNSRQNPLESNQVSNLVSMGRSPLGQEYNDYSQMNYHKEQRDNQNSSQLNLNQVHHNQPRDLPLSDTKNSQIPRELLNKQKQLLMDTVTNKKQNEQNKVINILAMQNTSDEQEHINPRKNSIINENIMSNQSSFMDGSNLQRVGTRMDQRHAQEVQNIEINLQLQRLNDDSSRQSINEEDNQLEHQQIGQDNLDEMLPETIAKMKKIRASDFNQENTNNNRFSAKVAKNSVEEQINSNFIGEIDNDMIINSSQLADEPIIGTSQQENVQAPERRVSAISNMLLNENAEQECVGSSQTSLFNASNNNIDKLLRQSIINGPNQLEVVRENEQAPTKEPIIVENQQKEEELRRDSFEEGKQPDNPVQVNNK